MCEHSNPDCPMPCPCQRAPVTPAHLRLSVLAVCPKLNVFPLLLGSWAALCTGQREQGCSHGSQARCSLHGLFPTTEQMVHGQCCPTQHPHTAGYGSKGRSQPAPLGDATDLCRAGPAAATIGASSWAAPVPKHCSEPLSHGHKTL